MIPLIGILLCIYLVFKGLEIFQIAWCSPEARGLPLGVAALITSTLVAIIGIYLFLNMSPNIPLPQP